MFALSRREKIEITYILLIISTLAIVITVYWSNMPIDRSRDMYNAWLRERFQPHNAEDVYMDHAVTLQTIPNPCLISYAKHHMIK